MPADSSLRPASLFQGGDAGRMVARVRRGVKLPGEGRSFGMQSVLDVPRECHQHPASTSQRKIRVGFGPLTPYISLEFAGKPATVKCGKGRILRRRQVRDVISSGSFFFFIAGAVVGVFALGILLYLRRMRQAIEETRKHVAALSSDLTEVNRSLHGLSLRIPAPPAVSDAEDVERRFSEEREEEMRRYLEEEK